MPISRTMTRLTLVAALGATALGGCDDGDDADPSADVGGGGEGGMGGGGAGDETYTVRFAGRVGDEPAACGVDYAGLGTAGTTARLLDFRMYVHDVALVTADGEVVPLALEQDGLWQHAGVALLDFEDGTGPCAETGNAPTRDVVVGAAPAGDYTGLRFTLGVPAALNHAEATTAPSPLNIGSMFWVWQFGYKFLRLDLQNDNAAPDDKWFIHLGSSGCVGDAPTTAPSEPCAQPNRATVTLDGFDVTGDVVVVDVAALLSGSDVSVNTAETPPGCMSGPVDADECPAIFERLGLGWPDGVCADDCGGQAFFRVEEGA